MGDIITGLVGWWKLNDEPPATVPVDPPTNLVVNIVEDGSGNYYNWGYGYKYTVVAYKVVLGITYYSSSIVSPYIYDSGNGDSAMHIDVSWDASVAPVDGYIVQIYNEQFGAYDDYIYTLAGTSFTDGDGTEGSFVSGSIPSASLPPFLDSSGNGATGTGTGNVTAGVAANFEKAAAFTDTGYITASDAALTFGTGARSVGFWMKWDTISGYQGIFGTGFTSGANDFYALTIGGSVCIGRFGGGDLYSIGQLTAGVWTHVALTYDGHNTKIYLNGAYDTGETNRNYNSTSGGYILFGKDYIIYDQGHGALHDFRWYNRCLSAADVAALYAYRPSSGRRRSSVAFLD